MNYVFLYGNIFLAAWNVSGALELMERGDYLSAAVGFFVGLVGIIAAWLAWRRIDDGRG